MSEPLLSARSVTKSYTMGRRTLEVLRGVSLDVMRGEFLALRGASGAGKSTLLHLFGGLDTPNAGEIWFAGKDLAHMPANAQSTPEAFRQGERPGPVARILRFHDVVCALAPRLLRVRGHSCLRRGRGL